MSLLTFRKMIQKEMVYKIKQPSFFAFCKISLTF